MAFQDEANELGLLVDPELAHQVGAMGLDRPRTDRDQLRTRRGLRVADGPDVEPGAPGAR